LREGRDGLTIANDGEPAYDISAPETGVPIGPARLKFMGDISRLTKDDGEAAFETFIEISPHNMTMGSGLFDQLRKSGVTDVTFAVRYKDGGNRWYKSLCRIERDVHATGGLTARFVGQRRTKFLGFLG
jgi:hypothetical protein